MYCVMVPPHVPSLSPAQLDIVEPKEPEHIYKTHLENARFSSANSVDSAKQNLASSFVNGFVNCAFGKDNIMTEDGNKWIYKHKPTGLCVVVCTPVVCTPSHLQVCVWLCAHQ